MHQLHKQLFQPTSRLRNLVSCKTPTKCHPRCSPESPSEEVPAREVTHESNSARSHSMTLLGIVFCSTSILLGNVLCANHGVITAGIWSDCPAKEVKKTITTFNARSNCSDSKNRNAIAPFRDSSRPVNLSEVFIILLALDWRRSYGTRTFALELALALALAKSSEAHVDASTARRNIMLKCLMFSQAQLQFPKM